jgi:hypothetical protein
MPVIALMHCRSQTSTADVKLLRTVDFCERLNKAGNPGGALLNVTYDGKPVVGAIQSVRIMDGDLKKHLEGNQVQRRMHSPKRLITPRTVRGISRCVRDPPSRCESTNDNFEQKVVPDGESAKSFDAASSAVRYMTRARCAVVIVDDGEAGSGYSVMGPLDAQVLLPDIFRQMAETLRGQLANSLQ